MKKANPESIRALFARNLKLLRHKKNMSQEQLAEVADLHRTYVSSVERGERNISLDNIEKLANALESDIRILLTPENESIDESTPRQKDT
ncbi:MAG: helix-turn-helix transcriptional regulator [Methylococcales bacterium]|nr:helix-turn-helix transcriptional regulator [Methylococcales bacterium]